MNKKYLCPLTLAGILLIAAGCDQTPDSRPSTSQADGKPSQGVPAPGRSQDDPAAPPPTQAPDPAVAGGDPPDMSEFAAFDTDANGMLVEKEWQQGTLNGEKAFDEIDADDSGDVDAEEFREAFAEEEEQQIRAQTEASRDALDPTMP